ncbi:MAG TPA: YciI family protein [Pyrinomonadaceae bacterium]
MKYMLLIYDREQDWLDLSEAEKGAIYADYMKFSQDLKDNGNYVSSSQLHPTNSATSVRIRGEEQLVTDGPFAETHEQLGGYYLVEAKDLDEATAIASRIPSAKLGTIEIRPLVERATPACA